MLLHRTTLMELHYDPKTDILKVKWPNIQEASGPELEHTFGLVRESIKHYFIKKFLIDSREAVSIPDKDVHLRVSGQFIKALTDTDLQKIARIGTTIAEREARTAEVIQEVNTTGVLTVQYRNFTDEPSAISWLLE